MAYKMKGPYHYGAYKKVKSCGRSVYKKDNPTYKDAFENMETAPGATRGSSVRINPRSGEKYENTAAGLEKFTSQAKAYNAKKAAKTTSNNKTAVKKPATIKAPNTQFSLAPGGKSKLADLGYSKGTKRKMKRQALVNKVKNALRPTGQAAKDVAKIASLAKRIVGDGSKRRANEARKAKRRRNPGSRRRLL